MVGRVSATIWGSVCTSEWTKLFKWRTEKRRGLRGLGKTAQLCPSTITCVSKQDPLHRWQHELNWRTFGSPDLTNFSSQMFLAGAKNSHQSYECVNGKRQPRGVLFTMIAQWEGKLPEMCISPLFLSSCWLVYKLELLTGLCSFSVEGLQLSTQQASDKLWLTEQESHTLKEQQSQHLPRGQYACEICSYKRLYYLHIFPPLVIIQD